MTDTAEPLSVVTVRLRDAISGERRDWHVVEVRPDDIAALLSERAGDARVRAALDRLAAAVEGLDHYPGHVMRPPNAQRWLDRAAVLALIAAEQEASHE